MSPGELDALAAAIVERVIDRLRDEQVPPPSEPAGLVDVRTLAARLGVSPSFVYEHSAALGAKRLGRGPKARLRFDLRRAREANGRLTPQRTAPEPRLAKPRPRRAAPSSSLELLPIREAS